MTPDRPLDPETVAVCHKQYQQMLEKFAWAILKDWSLAADAVQNGFIALSRFGGDVHPEARKGWLFKVVQREAMRVRATEKKHSVRSNKLLRETAVSYEQPIAKNISQREDLESLKQKVNELPTDQRTVLRLRIYEDLTFAEIASRLNIPLGTALSRMRLAIEKLKEHQHNVDEPDA